MATATMGHLRDQVRGEILTPEDPAYDDARRVYNAMIDRRERVKAAAEQLLTSEGWQRWVRVRRLASAGPLAGRVHRHQLRTTDR